VPLFFFGNTKILTVVGGKGSDSLLSKISRQLRMSLVFFYGRWFLPVPYRHPIHLASGEVIPVTQNSNPTDEDVQKVMDDVVAALQLLYDKHKPEWEQRPLMVH
jgi:diacylglycerol O-acyltransferase 2, plant